MDEVEDEQCDIDFGVPDEEFFVTGCVVETDLVEIQNTMGDGFFLHDQTI